MQRFELKNMKGGWFLGDFEPAAFRTPVAEVCCKHYRAGDAELRHVHRVATELTLIVSGRARMNGVEYGAGDIVQLEPGEATDFLVLEDTITVVVKTPSVMGDKYPA
jgi:hypothetical protein